MWSIKIGVCGVKIGVCGGTAPTVAASELTGGTFVFNGVVCGIWTGPFTNR